MKIQSVRLPLLLVIIFIFSPILSLQATASPAITYTLPLTAIAIFYIICKGGFHFRLYHCFALLLYVSFVISSFWSQTSTIDIKLLKYFSFICFYICITSINYSEKEVKLIIKLGVYLSIIISILIFLSYCFRVPHLEIDGELGGRYSIDIIGVSKNPNYLTSFINLFLLFVAYNLLYAYNTVKRKLILSSVVLLIIVAIYLTGTRAALLTSAFVFLSLLLSRFIRKNNLYFVIFLFVITIVSLISYDYLANLYNNFVGERNFFEDVNRIEAWTLAIDYFTDCPLLGYGNNAWRELSSAHLVIPYLHNIPLELLLSQGVIGFSLFIYLSFYGITRIKVSDRFIIFLLLFVTYFPLFFQNGYIEVNLWRALILTRIFINFSISNKDGLSTLLSAA